MYDCEELEWFYVEYKTEWMPLGMPIQAYCSRKNVPYKVLDVFIHQLGRKVVEIWTRMKRAE